jgi:hypothetical protein
MRGLWPLVPIEAVPSWTVWRSRRRSPLVEVWNDCDTYTLFGSAWRNVKLNTPPSAIGIGAGGMYSS